MLIVLLRHGKPAEMSAQQIHANDLKLWVAQYNNAPLHTESHPADPTLIVASQCNLILSSDLLRSKDSASMLSSFQPIVENSMFSEAEIPYTNRKYYKAKPRLWLVVFRILWYLGYSNGSESRAATKKRSEQATQELINRAKQHQCIMLVGHGIFNRFLAKELIKQGLKVLRTQIQIIGVSVLTSGNQHNNKLRTTIYAVFAFWYRYRSTLPQCKHRINC